ncbi:hypothetical protein E2C01_041616 [Portunus trituberculatus]|uniref:Uncharacterized protein n=1 Tax=Portunus trituberculatus TaxID=210409 RepID=A0A5B7FR72_PORTR|nr:hypothetical protein [Portunus trituberculatus]
MLLMWKKLASGDLLVQTVNLWFIHDIEIEASIKVSMNSCRGVASHRDFVDMEPTDIVDCMIDQHVTEARKITKMVDGTRSTTSVIFIFSAAKLPERFSSLHSESPPLFQVRSPWQCLLVFSCLLRRRGPLGGSVYIFDREVL